MILEFNQSLDCSIKSLAVNKNYVVKPTSRFFNGKMLMFAKLSLMSFIYKLVEVFYFPNEKTKRKNEKYLIEKNFFTHILTDRDKTSEMFVFICKIENNILGDKFREIVFKVIISNDIVNRALQNCTHRTSMWDCSSD